ncbi:uncharacterized protein LOC119675299 [Teleopsis dalmanni]|uniref:uncharacterized protein LOC119675299 n=1 Tax=Teleopsis dalmanni TaxID=139649 RepID=UPI0018CEAE71|nr:uncharacterized protein LOC119675299 [Teleopsis dalmanni]XP_037942428.1 uncharacterized protein LOC119675299 [Teleopsis dalmanni]
MSSEKQEQDKTGARSSAESAKKSRKKEVLTTDYDEEVVLARECQRMRSLTSIPCRNKPTNSETRKKEVLTNDSGTTSADGNRQKISIVETIKKRPMSVHYATDEPSAVSSRKNKAKFLSTDTKPLTDKIAAVDPKKTKPSIVETLKNSFMNLDIRKIKSSTLGCGKDEYFASVNNITDESGIDALQNVDSRKNSTVTANYSKGGAIIGEYSKNEQLTGDFRKINEQPSTSFETLGEMNDRTKHNERVQDLLKNAMSFSSTNEDSTESQVQPNGSTFKERCAEISTIFKQVSEIYMNKNETAEEHNKLRDLHNMLAERYISMALATENDGIHLHKSTLQQKVEEK